MKNSVNNNIEIVNTVNGRVINKQQDCGEWQKVSCTMEYPNMGNRKDTYDAKHYAGILMAPWYTKKEPRLFQFGTLWLRAWTPRNDREEWLVETWTGNDEQWEGKDCKIDNTLMTIDRLAERLATLYNSNVKSSRKAA